MHELPRPSRSRSVVGLVVVACVSLACSGTADRARRDPSSTTTTSDVATLVRYRDYRTKNYDDPSHWLCRPDTPADPCHRDLDATVIQADGSTSIEHFTEASDPKIDCFYVYPTISKDPTPFSDWNASPDEEGLAAYNQVARLRSQCRVFAPVYRQRTLAGLVAAFGGQQPDAQGDPFADVLDAWRTYMSRDNEGRGVVLVGHSQGSGMLVRLLREEIDPNPDVRAVLVGAYLAGVGLRVPDAKLVGGDLANVPICARNGEIGCVTTWATFRSTAPPVDGALFGMVRGSNAPGEAACANPAGLAGGDVDVHSYFPAKRTASILTDPGGAPSVGGWLEGVTIATPFVALPGLLSGECVRHAGFHFLSVTVHPDPGPRADDITGDLTPQWGLHLVDLNVVMGDVVARVADQVKTFTR